MSGEPSVGGLSGDGREVELLTRAAVPAVALRAALAVVGGALLAVAGAGAPGGGLAGAFLVVGVVLVGVLVVAPASFAAAGVVLAAGLCVLAGGTPPLVVVLALVLLVHVLLWCSAVVARVAWRGRVEVDVLTVGLRRVAGVQVGAQALAVVAALVTAPAPSDLGRAVAIVAATAVAWAGLSRPVVALVGRPDH